MTTDRDFDRIAAAWLDLMPDRAPDRIVEEILEDVALTPQSRRPVVRVPWTSPRTDRIMLIAATVLLGAALLGGALLVGASRNTAPIPTAAPVVPSVAPTGTVAPTSGTSPSAAASPSAGQHQPVEVALRSTWVAQVGTIPALANGSGPIRFTVDSAGTHAGVANLAPGATFESTLGSDGSRLRLTLDRDSGGCPAGAVGVYDIEPSSDGATLTLTPVSDDCPTRSQALDRSWSRSLVGATSIGAGIVDAFAPFFSVVMPDDTYEPRVLTDYVEIAGPNHSIQVWKNPQGFASACSQVARYPYTPGADAFAEYLAQNDAFTVIENKPMTIDGHHAVHVIIEGKQDYPPCPGQELMTWTPKDLDGHWILGPGDRDSVYLIDVGADTVMLEISPVASTASDKPIVDSIRIPVFLPGQ